MAVKYFLLAMIAVSSVIFLKIEWCSSNSSPIFSPNSSISLLRRSKSCLKTFATPSVQSRSSFSISFSTNSLNFKFANIDSFVKNSRFKFSWWINFFLSYKFINFSSAQNVLIFFDLHFLSFFTRFLNFVGDIFVRSFYVACIHFVWNEWSLWAERSLLEKWPLIWIDLPLRAKFCSMRGWPCVWN